METDERGQLGTFLGEFADLIDWALKRHPEWFPERLLDLLKSVWDEEVRDEVKRVRSAIESGAFDRQLEDEGLSGEQLRLKMATWALARSSTGPSSRSDPPEGWLARLLRRIRGGLRPFQGALKIANAILESIGKAIPPVGAVKEFKDILDGSIDLDEGRGGLFASIRRRLRRR